MNEYTKMCLKKFLHSVPKQNCVSTTVLSSLLSLQTCMQKLGPVIQSQVVRISVLIKISFSGI